MSSSVSEDDYEYQDYRLDSYEEGDDGPPLIKIKSQIILTVVNHDFEGFKFLANYSNLTKIKDKCGNSLLHIAILTENIEVFDFLLSIDDYPLAVCNNDGETALKTALTGEISYDPYYTTDHFAYSLIKNGANIDIICYQGNTLLHCAIARGFTRVAQLLIDKGVDINAQNFNGETPLHSAIFRRNPDETVGMLLYFGADPSIPDFKGLLPLHALLNREILLPVQENLFLYTFDMYSTYYDFPSRTLFNLMELDSPILSEVLKHITSIRMDIHEKAFNFYYVKLFVIKLEYLKLLIDKFDYVIKKLLNECLHCDFIYFGLTSTSIHNFNLLVESHLSSDVIQCISKINIGDLMKHLQPSRLSDDSTFELIYFLLSYGANISDADLKAVHEKFDTSDSYDKLNHDRSDGIIIL